MRKKCWSIWVIWIRPEGEAELTVLRSTFSVNMIAWDAELHLLEKLKQHKLIDQSEPIWAVTYGSSLSVSCAITHWLPTFQENPVTISKNTVFTNIS